MTDDEKLAKAWQGNWMKWTASGWEREVGAHLEVIERCQRIRANLKSLNWVGKASPHRAGA